ncbi:dynactin [Punctularia strigosozonata HHB-11173 SS5]|uniref:dynactin n=1 Tax=Punctularia strigosozonata (strain HHB-11173) TaxID=741275 RepID=UPI0004418230|nr:dynactin [Punctularia strigosozonata HHB-11173 SS5]EIN14288.1 dynactin [Punctularia strigosozonata HHB-11173 SS5]
MDPPVGAVVAVPPGRGTVRFCGATSFAPGKWVGVELNEPNGKNDGSINGVPYFSCRMGFGVFVRPSQVKLVSAEPDPPLIPASSSRATLGHQRTNSGISLATRQRTNSGAGLNPALVRAPSTRSVPSPRSVSPAKSGAPSPAPGSRLTAASPSKRASLAPAPRKSLTRTTSLAQDARSSVPQTPRTPTTPTAPPPPATVRTEPIASPTVVPPPAAPRNSSPLAFRAPSRASSSVPDTLAHDLPPPPVDDSELQELRAKIRVLEAHRTDDARRVRELETRLSEAESFVALRPKLQAKLQAQQTELIEARRALADARGASESADARMLDVQEQLEMATLDKEMAEERAEAAEIELEEVKERLAMAEVELDVLKEERELDGDAGPADGGKSTLAYIQLEKQNERLKEALVRLRDMSQETEQEQRRRIAEMEKDIMSIDDLQGQYETTLGRLANAEAQVEDLKLQLDDAMGAEEMLVQLTERNLLYSEKIEEMRITIEDLEALKELNDELEENHMETEKAMQEDIDRKDMLIRERDQKIESLEDACLDLDNTISQFRDLVMQLQSELDTLRMQTQTAQTESTTAASQAAAMMSLNLKLQSSASKNQARGIELELRAMEAREARELLGIIQPYLPQLYVDSDSDATSCYLFFQRLAGKMDLVNSVVASAHSLPESLNGPVSETLVGICEMRGRISSLSTLCKRFAAILRRCDPQSFLDIGRIYPEIAPMEKRIDMHIELLRRDEFREMECVSDVAKIYAQFKHLGETFFDDFDHDLGERELGYALSFDHDLDMFAAAVGLSKTQIAQTLKDEDIIVELGDLDAEEALFEPMQKLLDQCKTAKVLSRKLTKRLEELIQDSNALKPHLIPQLQSLNNAVPELTNFAISLAQQIMPHISDARSSKAPFQLSTILSYVRQTAGSTVCKGRKDGSTSWEAIGESVLHVVQEVGDMLPLALEPDNVIKVSGKAPWVVRIDEIKASLAVNLEAERKLAQLNDEVQGLVRGLKAKDQHIQEASVKIELMERRMEAVKKQAEMITELEEQLNKARKQERTYEEAMEQLQAEYDALVQENTKLKTMAPAQERPVPGAQVAEPETLAVEGNIETSYLLEQLEALRGTVRFLRTENAYLKGQDLLREIQSLPPLPEPAPRTPTPPLDPSLSDSASDDSDSELATRPLTLRSLATETKILYRDVIKFSSSPKVVDLSVRSAGRSWMPKKKTPAYQVWERKMEAERLSRRVHGLMERARAIS